MCTHSVPTSGRAAGTDQVTEVGRDGLGPAVQQVLLHLHATSRTGQRRQLKQNDTR